MRVCKFHKCGELTDNVNGYCDEHLEEFKKKRSRHRIGKGGKRRAVVPFYWRKPWRMARRRQLAEHPLCAHCGVLGEEVDHIIPMSMGGGALDPENLQTLCSKCHNMKSQKDREKYGNVE